jgi:hypothetical protein
VRALLNRLLAGRAPADPLYLTNRTWQQKLRSGLVIGIPCVLLAGAVALGLSHMYAPKSAPPKALTNAEIVAGLLPDLEKTVDTTPPEADISELYTDTTGSPKLIGTLRNNTGHTISVQFTVDLANRGGSKVETVTERVENVPPKSSVPFKFPIKDPNAATAIVEPRTLRVVN